MKPFDTEEMVTSGQEHAKSVAGPERFVMAAAVGMVVAAAAVFAAAPGAREPMLREDGPIEILTAATFLIAAAVGARRWVRTRHPSWSWAVPVVALVGFLDELSFGTRIFGWTPPRVSGIDVDALHDIFDLAERWAEYAGLGRTHLALMALAASIVVFAFLATNGRWRQVSHWLATHPPIAWLVVACAALLGAIALDLVGTSQVVRLAEESLEFTASALILSGALAIGAGARRS